MQRTHPRLTPTGRATDTTRRRPRLLVLMIGAMIGSPLIAVGAWASAAPSRVEVTINGMVCSFCVQGIERKIRALPATQSVKVDIQKHLVDISLRQGQTIGDDQLRKLIRDAGFDVREIKRIQAAP